MNNKNNICYNKNIIIKQDVVVLLRCVRYIFSLSFFSRWYNGTYIFSMYIMYYYIMNYLVKIMKYYNGIQFNRT